MNFNKPAELPLKLHEQLDNSRRRQILAAVATGTFMSALDSSVVNIALPKIGAYFKAPLSIIEWVVMAYLLIISSLLLTYGRMGDMYGHKKIYITGFIIFTAGSLLCGMAPTIAVLIISRGIQALGAGMLMSMGPAIITDTTPPQQRGKALGVNAVAVAVALTTGPIVGGFLTSQFGWQSIFYINLPVGVIGIIWASKVIPDSIEREVQPFDIKGAVVIFLALTSLLVPLSYTEQFGWKNPYIIAALVMGFMLLLLFVYIEKRTAYPMVDLALFKNRLFSMSNVSALLNYMAQFSVILLMPFYLQQLRQLPPSEAGLMLIPMPLTTMLVAPISGAMSDRFDSRYISSIGMGIVALGTWQLSNLNISSTNFEIVIGLATVGLGSGMFQAPNNSAIMGSVPDNRRGIASGMLATMRNIGMVLGVAVSGAIFSNHMGYLYKVLSQKGITGVELRNQAFTGAFHLAYIMASILAWVAVVTSLARGSTKLEKKI
ncbi:MAG: hypothetical protein PWR27_145 [Petroclostridium sp.]|jgi:EmrB/QacA subfamily drug resistance transporter|nr:drug resistance transporter, EmrB/QacA subfamily [Clostridia bacterium]MDK2809436.1 hypothetical protein [Petroclostridium sp.]